MRHLDYLLEEWDLDREVESVRLCVERIREGIDRYYIYLEAAAGESELAPGEVYESMFVPGWLGCRWGLRRQLGVLFRGPLTDGRARPLIWFLRGRSRVVERLLRRHERARGLGQTEMAAALRAELTELDERLVSVIRLKVLELYREPTSHGCPSCGVCYVTQEEFFGGVILLGCELCGHAETAREGEVEALLKRWTPRA